ncbi:heavy metal-responsive transcriptional regulator [Streptomyces scabiei]|uniref:heavy metal-responsive transcriptional regulator n=1 Tax=Streptomyces scabiei TaxID=1930 RepID=UPI000765D7DC|nr:heavy metal-responsive transcriptional regulator [Streptomyces scabiei]
MRISSLATATGLTTKTIRYYEQSGLLPAPPRTAGGYRDYPPAAQPRLTFIRDAQAAGLSLAEIRGVLALRDSGQALCPRTAALIEAHLRHIEERITALTRTQAALRQLTTRAS